MQRFPALYSIFKDKKLVKDLCDADQNAHVAAYQLRQLRCEERRQHIKHCNKSVQN